MTISVAMATYNGVPFLREQLDSIFSQTRLPDELIVCDDRSTDETVGILRDYARRAPFPIKAVTNDERLGSTKNFEKAIGLCSGDIIALSDQDDVWVAHKLQVIEERFASEPDLGLVFSNGYLIDETGRRLPSDMWSRWHFHGQLQRTIEGRLNANDLLLSRHFVTGATMAFRSKWRRLILPIPDGIETYIHDRWIAVTLAAVARIGLIKERLIAYRLHPKQQMGVGRRTALQEFLIPAHCSSDRRGLLEMKRRLTVAEDGVDPAFLHALETRLEHLAARIALPDGRAKRAVAVIREYVSGGYTLYSLGHAQAFRDLLVGTR